MVRCVFVTLHELCARNLIANVFQEDEENWRFSSSYVVCLALICTHEKVKIGEVHRIMGDEGTDRE
jgi:hypothetical protein